MLEGVLDTLRDAGAKLLESPWLQQVGQYVHANPWTSLGIALGVYITWKMVSGPRNLPPGPFNIPVLGATAYLRQDMEVKLMEVRPIYGDVIYFKLLGNSIVILNSERAIREALVRRGEEFAHRQISVFMKGIDFTKDEIFMAPYDDVWKANKKFAVTTLKNFGFGTPKSEAKMHSGVGKLEAIIAEKAGSPFNTLDELKHMTTAIFFAIFFNQDLPLKDPWMSKMMDLSTEFSNGFNEGVVQCDFLYAALPEFLRKFLARSALKRAKVPVLKLMEELVKMINEHKQSVDPNDIRDFIDQYAALKEGIDPEVLASNVLVLMPDSIHTVAVAIHWMLFYVAKYKDVQKKLHEEIDEAIGKTRAPSLSDKSQMPFAEAIVLETLRCSDMVAMTPAREMAMDVEFEGHTIPKGTIVIASLHATRFDTEFFPNPNEFDPSRFIGPNGKLDMTKANHFVAFGLGRRMCMGEMYSKSQIFLALVRLAQKFNINLDPSQPEPTISPDPSSDFVKMPQPHKLCLNLR